MSLRQLPIDISFLKITMFSNTWFIFSSFVNNIYLRQGFCLMLPQGLPFKRKP